MSLIEAIINDDVELVTTLIKEGASVSETKKTSAPLYYVNHSPQGVDIARVLIAAGADVNALTAANSSVLHSATYQCYIPLMRLLLESGIKAYQETRLGRTPLLELCADGSHGLATSDIKAAIDLLIEYGADINKKDNQNMGAMALAYMGETYNILLVLSKYDCDQTINGEPLLFGMVHNASYFKKMVNDGQCINTISNNQNLLFRAINHNKTAVVKFLISKGIDINYQNKHGHTPIIHAANITNKKQVLVLLHAGSDLTIKDKSNNTVLDYLTFDDKLKSKVEKIILEQDLDDIEQIGFGL